MSDHGSSDDENEVPSESALEEANSRIREAYDILRREATRVRKEREAFESVAKKLKDVHFGTTVKLNVGGQYFSTSVHTLNKDPGSMLHAMFSGRFDTKPAEDGSFFIDRDGTHFRFILNYLRTGKLLLPEDKMIAKEVLAEAEFYQIHGIVDQLMVKPFEESTIITSLEQRNTLAGWLPRKDSVSGDLVLLYRATRDGWAAGNFHSSCDNKGATIVVIKVGTNIFGGYAEQSWDSVPAAKRCTKSFLFSLVNGAGVGPTKMALKAGKEGTAMNCHSSYGPWFGASSPFDLIIYNGANANNSSSSTLNNSYECPPNCTYNTFLAGSQNFYVNEIEVFGYQK